MFRHIAHVRRLLDEFPVVALLGAGQAGKTTLARQLADGREGSVAWFDLEDRADLVRLRDPGPALRPLRGLVVLDEIHRVPDILQVLRVLADRPGAPARFLLVGRASTELLRQTSESLAGLVGFHALEGLDAVEVGDWERLWLRGGLPQSYLASSDAASRRWRDAFVRTIVTRDLPDLGSTIRATTLLRFWTRLAHWHGQVWNGAQFGRAFGVSHTTVRRYLDLLTSVLAVRRLQPWVENIRKRQDSGVLHALLGLTDRRDVTSHPKVGASWEGFVVQQIARLLRATPEQCFHWSTHTGAKLDLLVLDGPRRRGFRIKRWEAPRLTRSMRSAVETLGLDRLDVVHAGRERYRLAERVRAVPLDAILPIFPDMANMGS